MITQRMIDDHKRMLQKLVSQAKRYERLKKSGEAKLKRFSLLIRLIKFNRFKKVRKMIKKWEMSRSTAVIMALGGARQLKRMERNFKDWTDD
jgi:hypothetical protein